MTAPCPSAVMLLSDFIGLAASIALAIPAVKDQYYRFSQAAETRRKRNSPWPGLRGSLVQAWQEKRDSFDAWDSLLVAIGAAGLCASFLLKMFGG